VLLHASRLLCTNAPSPCCPASDGAVPLTQRGRLMQAARLWSASWALGEWRRWCGALRTAAAVAAEAAAAAEAAEDSREAVARRMLLRLRTRQVFSSWANYLAVRDDRGSRASCARGAWWAGISP
jgi:histidinol-phosphate/aromatic aminotransferase/cobyric acid decarboxylase-like protein